MIGPMPWNYLVVAAIFVILFAVLVYKDRAAAHERSCLGSTNRYQALMSSGVYYMKESHYSDLPQSSCFLAMTTITRLQQIKRPADDGPITQEENR